MTGVSPSHDRLPTFCVYLCVCVYIYGLLARRAKEWRDIQRTPRQHRYVDELKSSRSNLHIEGWRAFLELTRSICTRQFDKVSQTKLLITYTHRRIHAQKVFSAPKARIRHTFFVVYTLYKLHRSKLARRGPKNEQTNKQHNHTSPLRRYLRVPDEIIDVVQEENINRRENVRWIIRLHSSSTPSLSENVLLSFYFLPHSTTNTTLHDPMFALRRKSNCIRTHKRNTQRSYYSMTDVVFFDPETLSFLLLRFVFVPPLLCICVYVWIRSAPKCAWERTRTWR